MREAQLEERFYRHIFRLLGFEFEVQASDKSADFPDYALFKDRNALDNAHRGKGTRAFYDNALAVGEVKKWETELDKWGKDRHNKRTNPSFQIWLYLQGMKPRWGISPSNCHPAVGLFFNLFDDGTVDDLNNRIMKILEKAKPSVQESATEQVKSMTERVLVNIEASRDVKGLLRNLLNLMIELNDDGIFSWSGETDIEKTLDKILIGVMKEVEIEIAIRAIGQWARARRYIDTIDFSTDDTFAKISEIASDREDAVGSEALLTLTEFRDRNGCIPKNVFNAILASIWESHGRTTPTLKGGVYEGIAAAETDLEVIKAIYSNLTPAQKEQIQRIDKCIGAPNKEAFFESISKDTPIESDSDF